MISQEIMQRIQEIEISTKRMLSHVHLGNVKPHKKGSGLDFDQIRPYQIGDDVRCIDWKSTARASELLVRQYLEEKNRTIIICVDSSSSMFFSSTSRLKFEIAANVAATLALVGISKNDRVGLVIFSDKIEQVITPLKGKNHAYHIMNSLFSITPQKNKKSSLQVCAQYLQNLSDTRALVFVISDFLTDIEQGLWQSLQIKKEIIAIRCLDAQEKDIDINALLWMQDIETEKMMLVPATSVHLKKTLQEYQLLQKQILQKVGIDCVDLDTENSFVAPLISYFQRKTLS